MCHWYINDPMVKLCHNGEDHFHTEMNQTVSLSNPIPKNKFTWLGQINDPFRK